jgi:hypothetical protein
MYASFMTEPSGEDSVDLRDDTSIPKSGAGSRGTLINPISLTCAETEYMPYVGGQTKILSRPGMQKQRSKASIASSLPTPTKIFSGVMLLFVWVCLFRKVVLVRIRISVEAKEID